MLKIYINNEEVVANNDFTINKHMLNTPSVILNNVCPKEWKENKDYSSFYHPQDYSKCKIQDETYIPAEPGTYTTINGTSTIQNVSASKLQEVLQLDGDTTQETTTGKNLFKPTLQSNGTNISMTRCSVSVSGDEFTFVASGTDMYFGNVIATGSNYSNALGYLMEIPSGATTIYIKSTNNVFNKNFITFYDSSKVSLGFSQITDSKAIPSGAKYFNVRIGYGDSVSGTTYKTKIMLSTTGGDYEPYTNGASPNPTYPQPINVVSGRQEVVVCGKNLFNKNTVSTGFLSENGTITSNNDYRTSDFIPIKPNTAYYKTLTLSPRTKFYDSNKQPLNTTTYQDISIGGNAGTFTTPNNAYYLRFTINITTASVSVDTVMLNEGSTATTYEAYKGQSYEINLGKNLISTNTFTSTSSERIVSEATSGQTVYGVPVEAGQTYTASFDITVLPSSDYRIQFINSASASITQGTADPTRIDRTQITCNQLQRYSVSITPTQNGYLYLRCVPAGFTLDNIQIEKGSVASSFSPYKTPIELCKIGTYQDFIKKGTGKNLFDKDNITSGKRLGQNGQLVDDTNYFTSDFIPVKEETWYTKNSPTIDAYHRICYYSSNNESSYISRVDDNSFPTPANTKYVRFCGALTELDTTMFNEGNIALPYEPYGMYNKWYIEKQIGKIVLNGSENWLFNNSYTYNVFYTPIDTLKKEMNVITTMSNYYKGVKNGGLSDFGNTYNNSVAVRGYDDAYYHLYISNDAINSLADFKTWLSTHNTEIYYVLNTPTYEEITDTELIEQLNSIKLIDGLNNVSITSPYLTAPIYIHYNFVNEETVVDLLFCGVVKNSGKISLNPREPHLTTLQILDFKDFLSSGELDGFVIYQKTILEAIQMVIGNIQDYGFVLGNVNILNPNEVIGAYSTKDKTAYDVFNYLADITQSRWTTRLIDENTVAIDFYDPTLMVEGTAIDYTQSYFENNLIDNMSYNYGSNNYRNKQVMTSNQVYSNISQAQTMVANGYQTQFPTEQPIGKINSIIVDNIPMSFATFNEKDMGYVADFYYQPGDNYIESDDLRSTGEIIVIDYVAIVEGRQVITNPIEIDRIEESIGRKGIISRYETRNDATTSVELQKIGESYIKYKGTPEITITIDSRKNLWEVGQRVEFNAPIEELETEYMVRTKKINYIVSADTLFYTYELVSSFNSETEINYFDNQRAKSKGNIGEGEYISRNIDIESTANIIFYDTETTEVQVDGDNELNSILNSPFIS